MASSPTERLTGEPLPRLIFSIGLGIGFGLLVGWYQSKLTLWFGVHGES
jgi:NhaP-type Na+/H+ or K+/H+ antiporter